jgi:hypothetical protein
MPVLKCSNGKYRIGKGKCIYKSKASAERAYKGYLGKKYSESIVDVLLSLVESDRKPNLDPNFFNSSHELLTNIRDTLQNLSVDVLNDLNTNLNINIIPTTTILTGSLCGFNWDDYSDIDLHILVDYSAIPIYKRDLIKKTLALYAKNWNTENQYTLHNRKLELYFQDSNEKHESPGIYDITHNHWIKEPTGADIKTNGNVTSAADKYKADVQAMVDAYESEPNKTKEFINNTLEDVKKYWNSIRDMRKVSLKNDGLYGMGNLVFKQLRRNNTLQMIIDFMRKLKNDTLNIGE